MKLQRVGLLCEGGKRLPINACYFCHIHSSILLSLTSLFLPFFVSLFFPFQLFVLIALVSISFPLMGTVPIYTKSSSLDFTLLPLLLTNYFCLLQTPLRSAHYPFGL